MASETLHENPDELSERTRNLHRGIVSLIEELEAIDWYQQRAEACTDEALRRVLLHNRNEEIEHAAMTLEWIRRHEDEFARALERILFREGEITELDEHGTDVPQSRTGKAEARAPERSLGIGTLKTASTGK